MNRYAMPVDPRVLKKDFKTLKSTLTLEELQTYIENLSPFLKANSYSLRIVNNAFWELWKRIDSKKGINLRDREKLVPHFTLMGKLVRPKPLSLAYRGVGLSSYDPNLLSRTYPNIKKGEIIKNPQDPEVLAHLESLAYGLRSWAGIKDTAVDWSLGVLGGSSTVKKDKVVFVCPNPNVLFDATSYWEAHARFKQEEFEIWERYDKSPFDFDEKIIYLQNPKVKEISFDPTTDIWYVTVSD